MDHRWIEISERKRHSRQFKEPSESWQSNRYDFSDPDVRLEMVPEMGCTVGACISALKGSWTNWRIAGRNREPRDDLKYRIRRIESSLGIEESFPELEGMDGDEESGEEIGNEDLTSDEQQALREEKRQNDGEWDFETDPLSSELTPLDKQMLKEETEVEQQNDDWWFN